MAKISLNNVASGYNRSKINQNFTDLAAELQNKVLYRNNPTGEPNQLENDIDMNSKDIANTNKVTTTHLILNGKTVNPPDTLEDVGNSSLTTSTGTQTVAGALDGRVVQVASLTVLDSVSGIDGKQYQVGSFWPSQNVGSILLEWQSGRSKTEHNGGTIIDPDKISELGAIGVFGTYFTPAASGAGCFVSKEDSIDAGQFGFLDTNTATEVSINKAIQAASSEQRVHLKTPNSPVISGPINMKSHVKVVHSGLLEFDGSVVYSIHFDGVTSAAWIGGSIKGPISTGSGSQSAIACRNGSTYNVIAPHEIYNFPNKCVDISTSANRNLVYKVKARQANGDTGAGISIFGAGANRTDYNVVFEVDVEDCRGGVSVHGGYYNRVIRPNVKNCSVWGVGLDGVVTGSGDGARHTYVLAPVCDNASGSGFGGVYLGNGSSFNMIEFPTCFNNAGAGIRTSGGVGYEVGHNTIVNPVCYANSNSGMNLSTAPNTTIYNPRCFSNTGRGLQLFNSDNSVVHGGNLFNNTQEGFLCQSAKCKIIDSKGSGNDEGVEAASSGSDGRDLEIIRCDFSGNITSNYVIAAQTLLERCVGFKNENSGTATLLSGTNNIVVNHGLNVTPETKDIIATAITNPENLASFWVGGINSTSFSIFSNNTATTDVSFAWQIIKAP